MGRITNCFISDNLGNPKNQYGKGTVNRVVRDYSGSKVEDRLVLNIEVTFDTGFKRSMVIKIALLDYNGLPSPATAAQSATKKYHTIDKDLYNLESSEVCLLNGYLHEGKMYNFFSNFQSKTIDIDTTDTIIEKYVIKSYGSGISQDGVIQVINDLGQKEGINLFRYWHSRSEEYKEYFERFRISNGRSRFVYITTEYNPNYTTLSDGFNVTGDDDDLIKPKKINLIKSTLSTLVNLHMRYNFCHWDFHSGNVLYDRETGDIKLFDFDHATINVVTEPDLKNSKYIHFLPNFYIVTRYLIEKYDYLSDSDYYMVKTRLAHFYDIFQFLQGVYNTNTLSASPDPDDPERMSVGDFENHALLIQSFLEIIPVINNEITAILDWCKSLDPHFAFHMLPTIDPESIYDEVFDEGSPNREYIILYIKITMKHIDTLPEYLPPQWPYTIYIFGACWLLEKINNIRSDQESTGVSLDELQFPPLKKRAII